MLKHDTKKTTGNELTNMQKLDKRSANAEPSGHVFLIEEKLVQKVSKNDEKYSKVKKKMKDMRNMKKMENEGSR